MKGEKARNQTAETAESRALEIMRLSSVNPHYIPDVWVVPGEFLDFSDHAVRAFFRSAVDDPEDEPDLTAITRAVVGSERAGR